MVAITKGLFRVILQTPRAKLLDCRAGSLIVPTHDGQWGIMRNHCPLLAKLSLGILQVRDITDHDNAYYIVEGGFIRVTENHVTVLAYDVITFEGLEKGEIVDMVSEAQSVVAGQEYIRSQKELIDADRARLIVRMAELAGVDKEEA